MCTSEKSDISDCVSFPAWMTLEAFAFGIAVANIQNTKFKQDRKILKKDITQTSNPASVSYSQGESLSNVCFMTHFVLRCFLAKRNTLLFIK